MATLLDSKWLIAFISVLVVLVGTTKALLDNPVYKIDAMLQVEENTPSLGALEPATALISSEVPIMAGKQGHFRLMYEDENVEHKSVEAKKTLVLLDKQLPNLKEQLDQATTALNNYKTRHGSIPLNFETQRVLNDGVKIQTQITQLKQKRDELRQRFAETDPSVIAIDKQIARLQGQMNLNDKKIEALPEKQQVVLRLARDVKVNSELFAALLKNTQTLPVSKAGTVGNVRIIDYAALPAKPIKPKKALIVAVSFILGLIWGIALAFIRKSRVVACKILI